MLLGRERSLLKRTASDSKDKNRSLVRVASSSKIPKDFFKQETYSNKSCPTPNILEFTFMKPLENHYSTKLIKKPKKDIPNNPDLTIKL